MSHTTDVLVVGGGATGVGVARDCAMRGLETTLVERGGLAAGTSGRSHGLLHSGARYAESDREGAAECLAERRTLADVARHAVTETGGLFVQLADDDPAYFDAKREACRDLGMAVSVLDGDAARAAVPGLAAEVERAMRVPDAVVHPSRLVAATAASARDHGATVHTHAPVEDLVVTDGRVTSARVGGTVDATIAADFVVNATGAWAEQCAALADVAVPMRPTEGVMVAVEHAGIGPVLNRCREPADGDIVVPHGDQAVLGTTSVPVDDPEAVPADDDEVATVRRECAAMLPAVGEAAVDRIYRGVRPLYAPDEAARGDARGISRGFFVLDHAGDGAAGFCSVVGGKLTTYRAMAEAATDLVCDRLGVTAGCRTAEEPLPGDSPADLDRFVARFDAGSPADADVVATDP